MGKRQKNTPRSQIRSALRRLFLRSRERAATMKACSYTCQECGAKQSKAKGREVAVHVHHVDPIECWNRVIDIISEELLGAPMVVLCKECHKKEHKQA